MPKIQKTKVAVVLKKTLYISKGALSKSSIVSDAIYLAQKDFVDEINEKNNIQHELAEKGQSLLTSVFDNIEVIDSPKYNIPKNKEKKHSFSSYTDWNQKTIIVAEAIRLVVNYNLEKKYGPLDYEKNPNIFNVVPEVIEDGKVIIPQQYNLISSVETEFYNLRDIYSQILYKVESEIPDVKLVNPTFGEFIEQDEEYNEDEDYNNEDGLEF